VLGVDLRSSARYPSAVAGLDETCQVALLKTFLEDQELMELAQSCAPELVAIGTPLGLPRGLKCLETVCQCCNARGPRKTGREAELELARLGISCFFTSKGSIIKNLVYRGIELKAKLQQQGQIVVETFPHATKVMLFGDNVPPKNSTRSLAYWREQLPLLVKGLDKCLEQLDKNSCDALLNAYTGLLHCQRRTEVLGNAAEGQVVVPRQEH